MERCPNCGTPARPGAKFCTTCGFRFPGDATEAHDHSDTAAPTTDEESGLFPGAMTDGWPSPPPPPEPVARGWDAQAAAPVAAPAESSAMMEAEEPSHTWAAGAPDSWPAPPAAVAETPPGEPEPQPDEDAETPSVDSAGAANQAETAEGTARAMRLLDELRQAVAEMGPRSAVDLSEVISDLEVAVHPPGAMAADDVAELRDALLAARERPRDIDTIVDLTKRIEAMLALVIAYDRTIAAIERSLEALRGNG
jgi:hypothetical protein